MGRGGKYHQPGARATDCPVCAAATDRFGTCAKGHGPLVATSFTYHFTDFRDNLIVDPDAPVAAWRNEKGHRLRFENSHEAVAWNVFRTLELLGAAPAALEGLLGLAPPLELRYWAREPDASPWAPFADARASLEQYLRGPDVNGAEPDVVIVSRGSRVVAFVDSGVAAPIASRPPRWFATAATPAERRRRRAILDGMSGDEETAPFRRGVDDAIRRGFHGPARRLLLARASSRRIGDGWSGRLVTLVNPPTVKRALEDASRFRSLLTPAASEQAYAVATWAELWRHIPEAARTTRASGMKISLQAYLCARTVNRGPAHMIVA